MRQENGEEPEQKSLTEVRSTFSFYFIFYLIHIDVDIYVNITKAKNLGLDLSRIQLIKFSKH